MPRYWQEDPNHKYEWGESGGLPIDPRTIHTDVEEGRFISTDAHTVRLGGTAGHIPINQTERQKQRETVIDYGTVVDLHDHNIGAPSNNNNWDTGVWDSSIWG